jgi:fumarylacetoacetase
VLNDFASLPSDARTQIRATIIKSLSDPNSLLWTKEELNEAAFVQIEKSRMHLPMKITDYTDSFSSLVHAQNVVQCPPTRVMKYG